MERKPLLGLKPQTYEHPLDRKTLDSLQKTGGLETLVRKVNEWGLERMLDGIRATLERFGVRFDTWFSEQSLHDSGKLTERSSASSTSAGSRPSRLSHELVGSSSSKPSEPSSDSLGPSLASLPVLLIDRLSSCKCRDATEPASA